MYDGHKVIKSSVCHVDNMSMLFAQTADDPGCLLNSRMTSHYPEQVDYHASLPFLSPPGSMLPCPLLRTPDHETRHASERCDGRTVCGADTGRAARSMSPFPLPVPSTSESLAWGAPCSIGNRTYSVPVLGVAGKAAKVRCCVGKGLSSVLAGEGDEEQRGDEAARSGGVRAQSRWPRGAR